MLEDLLRDLHGPQIDFFDGLVAELGLDRLLFGGRAFSFLRTPDFDVFAFSFLRTPDVCESSPLPLQAIPRLFSAMQKVSSSDSYSCSLYSSSAFSYGE